MNQQRRKKLGDLIDRIVELQVPFGELLDKLTDLTGELETLRDEEQEAFDNLPESLQDSEKGQDAQFALEKLNEAFDTLEALKDGLEDHSLEDVCSDIDEARGNS